MLVYVLYIILVSYTEIIELRRNKIMWNRKHSKGSVRRLCQDTVPKFAHAVPVSGAPNKAPPEMFHYA
jgi:hypothetical protein